MKFLTRKLPIALLMLVAPATWADQGIPNNLVAVGMYWAFYHVHASALTGPVTPPGIGLDVKNLETPYFAYLRRVSTHLILELAGGIPPVTESIGKGPAQNWVRAA